MRYIKDSLENILNQEVTYTTEVNGLYYIYNYRVKSDLILTLKLSEEQFVLKLIMLPESMRRQRLGTKIISTLKKWAYENDYKKINLLAIHNSKEFWKKQNFIKYTNSSQMQYLITKKTFQ